MGSNAITIKMENIRDVFANIYGKDAYETEGPGWYPVVGLLFNLPQHADAGGSDWMTEGFAPIRYPNGIWKAFVHGPIFEHRGKVDEESVDWAGWAARGDSPEQALDRLFTLSKLHAENVIKMLRAKIDTTQEEIMGAIESLESTFENSPES